MKLIMKDIELCMSMWLYVIKCRLWYKGAFNFFSMYAPVEMRGVIDLFRLHPFFDTPNFIKKSNDPSDPQIKDSKFRQFDTFDQVPAPDT